MYNTQLLTEMPSSVSGEVPEYMTEMFGSMFGGVASGMLLALGGLLVAFVIGFFIWVLVLYILGSIGTSKIAKRNGMEKIAWLAWLPIGNMFLLGKLAINNVYGWVMLVLSAVVALFSKSMGSFSGIVSLGLLVCHIIATHKIYAKLSTKKTAMTVWSAISFTGLSPIFLFAIRNNEFVAQQKPMKEEKKVEQVENTATDEFQEIAEQPDVQPDVQPDKTEE